MKITNVPDLEVLGLQISSLCHMVNEHINCCSCGNSNDVNGVVTIRKEGLEVMLKVSTDLIQLGKNYNIQLRKKDA